MPGLFYVRCERPLTEEADRLRRIIREERIDFGIFDSVAFACDGPPEAAETASAYFRALRSLRIGSLNLAHITKSESGDQRPFGSIFWHNHARATWFIKRATDTPDTRCGGRGAVQPQGEHGRAPLRCLAWKSYSTTAASRFTGRTRRSWRTSRRSSRRGTG